MTTDTLTLTAFLLARIEEDAARAASDIDHFCDPNDNADKWITMYAKRLAAECAAKRVIIEAAWSDHERIEGEWGRGKGRDQMGAINDNPDVLVALAAVYADHDDYRAEWAL